MEKSIIRSADGEIVYQGQICFTLQIYKLVYSFEESAILLSAESFVTSAK